MYGNKMSRYSSLSKNFVQSSAASLKTAFPLPPSVASATCSKVSRQNQDAVVSTMEYGMNARKRQLDEDEALEEDEELEYIPGPDSPTGKHGGSQKDDEEEEDDPLDSFMANIEVQARKDKETCNKHEKEASVELSKKNSKNKLGRTDIECDDDQESYFQWVEENADKLGVPDDETVEDEIEYDEHGNPLPPKKKLIDPLPPVDHSKIAYQPFAKNFYMEHAQIAELTEHKVAELRKKLDIKVSGLKPNRPVSSFAHFGFDQDLMSVIRKSEYTQPTPIQSQAIPIALSGRDIIGIAKTGSGKTAAYLWPALVHIIDQRQLESGEGPICLIVVPTRELAIQVYNEAKRFGKAYNIQVVCAYGGGSKWEQSKALQDGAEIVVCTPGRLIDLVKIKATNLQRVSYLVFDEADRMFELGFEIQVRSIANHVRPDRQCLMFSATFKKRIERLARDALIDPVRIVQGELGEANEDIQQIVEIFSNGSSKYVWLTERLVGFCSTGKVLIFVSQKVHVDELAKNLKLKDFNVGALHGDMQQHERNEIITAFRKQRAMTVLVATDVAARGLDIHDIKTVVNYDAPKDIDTYIHRIGRTGRAGEKGNAYTLLVMDKDKDFAGFLVRNLETYGQCVPQKLIDLANQNPNFRKSRFRQGQAKKPGVGGRGLGFKDAGRSQASNSSSILLQNKNDGALTGFDATSAGIKEALQHSSSTGSDRLSAMKSAFSSTYKNAFHTASDGTPTGVGEVPFTDTVTELKKKSIEENCKLFKTPSHAGSSRSDQGGSREKSSSERKDGERRKKSRWGD